MLERIQGQMLKLAVTWKGKSVIENWIRCAVFYAAMDAQVSSRVQSQQLVEQCVYRLLYELTDPASPLSFTSDDGLEKNTPMNHLYMNPCYCNALCLAIDNSYNIENLNSLIVSQWTNKTLIHWCTGTVNSRMVVEALFTAAKRCSTLELSHERNKDTLLAVELTNRILSVMRQNIKFVATNEHGYLCFRHCYINASKDQQRQWLLKNSSSYIVGSNVSYAFYHPLCSMLKTLSKDQYGNFVVQNVIEDCHDKILVRECVRRYLLPCFFELSLDRYGAHVMEKLINCVFSSLSCFGIIKNDDKQNETPFNNLFDTGAEGLSPDQFELLKLRVSLSVAVGLLPPGYSPLTSGYSLSVDFSGTDKLEKLVGSTHGNYVVQAMWTHFFPVALPRQTTISTCFTSQGTTGAKPRLEVAGVYQWEWLVARERLLSVMPKALSTCRRELKYKVAFKDELEAELFSTTLSIDRMCE